MSVSYATLAQVKTQMGITATTYDTTINALLPAVSRAIDSACHRHFYLESATRYFDYKDSMRLWFGEDLYTLTTFTNGDATTLVENTNFYLWPYHGPPYQRLDIRKDVGVVMCAGTRAERALSIAGQWGYSVSAPAEIAQACVSWCLYLLNMSTTTAGKTSVSIGEYSVNYGSPTDLLKTMPGEVGLLVKPYIRREMVGVGW